MIKKALHFYLHSIYSPNNLIYYLGVVKELVDKYNSGELKPKESNQVVTALCLYCRESVNR